MTWHEKYKVDVPEGRSGKWSIERVEVSQKDSEAAGLRAMFQAGERGRLPPGTYTQLHRGRALIMSDTPDEIRDHLDPMRRAKGDVLIAGLGIGMVLHGVAQREDVDSVTVIEKSEDVIALVREHYEAKPYGHKITIIQADIFDWKPPKGQTWDYAWFDIWDVLCVDNLKEMTKLHRKFARRAEKKGSWGKEFLRMMRDRGRP